MKRETQLIIRRGGNINVLSISDAINRGAPGSQRIEVPAFPNQSTIVGTSVTLFNAAGETNVRFCNSIAADTPTPGFTRLNFNFPTFTFDFRLSAGGYFVWGDEKEYFIDLYEEESISQNFNFQDVGTFAPQGDFTREFRVPASDRNLEAFGLLDSFTFSDVAAVYSTKIPAEIRVDTLPIIRGHLRVLKTFQRNGAIGDIQLCFYGEAPDLFRSIGDKLLKEIENLPSLDTVIEYATVSSVGTELAWGLVDRGQRWDNTGSAGSRPLFNSELPLYAADFTPFVNAWTIFQNIITNAGFTLTPTPLETILSGYWCPWINSKNVIVNEVVGDFYFNAGFVTSTSVTDDNVLTLPQFVDNGGNYSGAFFEAPVEGFYSFRFWANVLPIGSFGPSTGGIKFFKFTGGTPTAGQVVVNFEVAVSGTDQNNSIPQRILFTTEPLYMLAGERMQPYTEFTGTPIFYGSPTNTPGEGTGWELFSYFRNWGDTFNAAANSPNVKQVDFVRDILQMHAAVIIPSRSVPNEITVISIIDYIGAGNVLNWTQKLDISKDITLSPTTEIQKRNFFFTYKNGGDVSSKLFTDNGRTYGEYKLLNGYTVNSSTPPNEFASGDFNIKLTAESTPAAYVNGTNIPIPKFINDKGEFVAPNLRFLFLADISRVPMYDDSTATIQNIDVNIFNHYSSVSASVGDYDLNFNPETPLHSITTNPFRNLFNEYWRDYLNGLYNPETRILEAHFALDLSDILTFKYSDRVFIKDTYWRILEISDYKIGLYESTKVKLMKLVNPAPDCELVPTTVATTGGGVQVIEFTDYAGDPQPATSTCCVRYGYQWEPILGQCLAFGTPIETDPNGGGSASAMMMNPGPQGTVKNTIGKTSNTDISVDNTFSVFVGENLAIEKGNQNTLAVGERLKMEGANRGSALLGRNAYANITGVHLGAGDRTLSQDEGASQTGITVFTNGFAFTASGQTLELFPPNDIATRLTLPDKTTWVCFYILHASDVNGFYIYETGSVYLEKVGGVTSASTPVVISSDNSGGTVTLTFAIDTATNTAQHRFKITSGGSGFPQDVNCNLTIYYTQIR
jgi:hypothetical protein